MNSYCYNCSKRFLGECNANIDTYEKKIKKPYNCPDFEQVLVKHVVRDNKIYHMIDDLNHAIVEILSGKEAKEKYGDCIWCACYSAYEYTDLWYWRKEN